MHNKSTIFILPLLLGIAFFSTLTHSPSCFAGEKKIGIPAKDGESTPHFETLIIHSISGEKALKMVNVEQVPVDKDCAKRLDQCLAVRALRTAAKPELVYRSGHVNPAVTYCHAVDGQPFIARAASNDEVDLCGFKDGSWIDAYYLYARAFPPEYIQ